MWGSFGVSGPPTDLSGARDQKLEHLAAHGDEYDTLLIGSSRIFRQLDPAMLDQVAGERGLPLHSFNCGVDAMFAPEDSYTLEQALKGRRQPLKWVLIETSVFLPSGAEAPNPPQRVVTWHDWPRTLSACRAAYGSKAERKATFFKRWSRRAEIVSRNWTEISGHLRCFLRRTTRLGRGGGLLQGFLAPEKTREQRLPIAQQRGFIAITEPSNPAEIAKFEKAMAERRADPAEHRALTPEAQRNLERMLSSVRKAGARAIMLHPPMPSQIIYEPGPNTHVPVLDYSDFNKYPILYALENRKEHAHLNARGAAIFSRIVAEDWAREVADEASKQNPEDRNQQPETRTE
jgi:hypothetical protein